MVFSEMIAGMGSHLAGATGASVNPITNTAIARALAQWSLCDIQNTGWFYKISILKINLGFKNYDVWDLFE